MARNAPRATGKQIAFIYKLIAEKDTTGMGEYDIESLTVDQASDTIGFLLNQPRKV